MNANPVIQVIDLLADLGRQVLENKPASSGVLGRETDEADETPAVEAEAQDILP